MDPDERSFVALLGAESEELIRGEFLAVASMTTGRTRGLLLEWEIFGIDSALKRVGNVSL